MTVRGALIALVLFSLLAWARAGEVPLLRNGGFEDGAEGWNVVDLAGATRVLRLELMMGQALARRVIDRDASAHRIGDIYGLHIAEASAGGTALVGQKIGSPGLWRDIGVSVVGCAALWLAAPRHANVK